MMPRFWQGALAALATMLIGGAARADVVIYTSVDEQYARPILEKFQKDTGIGLVIRTDAEAVKTVGLAERLRAEKSNPQCDVWWGNELSHTIRLAKEDVLAPYESPSAQDIPRQFRDAKDLWTGMGVRTRVIALSADPPPPVEISTLRDLLKPELKDRIAISTPGVGTVGGHVAALYVLWGDEKADAFFRQLHDNGMRIVGGNSVVAEHAGQGRIFAGITDNDDVSAAQAADLKLTMVDADADGAGTLAFPCTVSLVKGAPNETEAKKLIDYLLQPQAEQALIDAKYARYSVRDAGKKGVKFMDVDFAKVAEKLPDAVTRATRILQGRQ